MTGDMRLIRSSCCNYVNKKCLGIETDSSLFREEGDCYIEKDKQCPYYNARVVPLAKYL